MAEEKIEQFANAMVDEIIIESLQMCIYRFNISDDNITNSFLCQDHIEKKQFKSFRSIIHL